MQRQSKHRLRTRSRSLRGKRAVSEVLGTILILALTVTLFSSIFFFVSTFPKPAPQPAGQFQGQLFYSYITKGAHTWTNVSSVTVTHLGGPILYNFNTVFYVVSQAHPQNTTATYTMTSGGLGASSSTPWGTGQVWNLSLAGDHLTIPDNITVTIVSDSLVVYRQTLPGSNPTNPPIFIAQGTSPGAPFVNSPFSVFVQISDPFLRTSSKQVYLNITTPGLSCVNPLSAYSSNTTNKLQMTYNATNGLWFVPSCTTATSGTYYVTAWVTDSNPIQTQQNSIIFPITVSASGSGGGSTLVIVQILTNTSVPVINQKLNVTVEVTNNGQVAGTAAVSFGPAAGFSRSSASGSVPAGATAGFQATYTPTATGALLLNATASIPGLGTGSDSYALTVFPPILLISYNQPGNIPLSKSNESSNLASELTAAGFPFKTYVNSCTNGSFAAALVTQYFVAGTVLIVDFGTNSTNSGCPVGPSYTTPAGYAHSASYYLETAVGAGASVWVVGDRAFWPTASLACNTATYTTYLQDFGISAGATCVTAHALSASPADYSSVTYTATTASGFYSQGISSPITLNGNVSGTASALATYLNYQTYTASGGHVGTAFLALGANTLGIFYTGTGGAGKGVAIGADPVQFGDAPAGTSWNAIGTAVTYNVMNYLCGFATSSAVTRSGTDFGIAGALLAGTVHTAPSSFLVNLRANDISNGILTVSLLVNGVPVLYQGSYVTATAVESGNGVDSWVTLTWQAPTAGTYVFSFVLSTSPVDYFTLNNQYNYYVTNLGITFT
ncbi:MAG: type IV pilin N-terminal domain-containing protein [Thermoplasmata archaeon]